MSKRLPETPSLDHLRKQARDLLAAHRSGDADALARIRQYHPRYAGLTDAEIQVADFKLREAQLAIAREYRHRSWADLVEMVNEAQGLVPDVLQVAVGDDDLEALADLLRADSAAVHRPFRWLSRGNRIETGGLLEYASAFGSVEAMQMLVEAGADLRVLEGHLFGACENLNLEAMQRAMAVGVDPNGAYNEGWGCDVLHGCLQTYTRREPDHFHACINALVGGGAQFAGGPLWEMFRGRQTELADALEQDPELVNRRFPFDFGDHLTLRGATMLHIAVEYNLQWAVDVLLDCGADLNARVEIGNNGVGGQTPIFHAIGSNSGRCYDLFEYLLTKGPDLSAKAQIQVNHADDGKVMDCVHKGKDHFFEAVREVTPLGYALWYENEPGWRQATREVERLREVGAPEE